MFLSGQKNYPYHQNLENVDVVFHHKCCLDTHISFVFIRPLNQSTFVMRHGNWSSDEVFWWLTKDEGHCITEGKQWERAMRCSFLKYNSSFKLDFLQKYIYFLWETHPVYLDARATHMRSTTRTVRKILVPSNAFYYNWSLKISEQKMGFSVSYVLPSLFVYFQCLTLHYTSWLNFQRGIKSHLVVRMHRFEDA